MVVSGPTDFAGKRPLTGVKQTRRRHYLYKAEKIAVPN
jgi:hypothetical protein